MIEHEGQLGVCSSGLQRRRKFPGPHQQVVTQSSLLKGLETPVYVLAQQPSGVGFVVYLVANSQQKVSCRGLEQRVQHLSHPGIAQVHPAHHPGYEGRLGGDLEKFLRLRQARAGLHQNRVGDGVPLEFALEVLWGEIPL